LDHMWQTHNIQLANFYKSSFVSNREKGALVKLNLSDDIAMLLSVASLLRDKSHRFQNR